MRTSVSVLEATIAEFTNSMDIDEVTDHEPPHLDLHSLPSCLWVLNMIKLGLDMFWKFADENLWKQLIFYSLFTICYIYKYFIDYLHRSPWHRGSHGGLSILRMWVRVQVTVFFFFSIFFFSLLLVQCKFNSNLMSLLRFSYFFYPFWCPGLQRLQHFDSFGLLPHFLQRISYQLFST